MENNEINKYILRKKRQMIKKYEIKTKSEVTEQNCTKKFKINKKKFIKQKSVMESTFENIQKYKNNKNKINNSIDKEKKIINNSFKICKRYPHKKECFCEDGIDDNYPYNIIEVYPNIYIGLLSSAITIDILNNNKITHILNVSCNTYTQNQKCEYFNLDVQNNHKEDIKKYFRITNRFIQEALLSPNNKILIHGYKDLFRPICFFIVYKIGLKGENLKKCFNQIKKQIPNFQINEYFIKQLEFYDLDKLAVKRIKDD